MAYVKTKLKQDIRIDSIVTIHYFEYMRDFVFKGESHDFWEFLYVDKGTISVCSDDAWVTLNTGDVIFHQPNEFHAFKSIGENSPNLVAMSFVSDSPAMDFFKKKVFTLSGEERSLISRIIAEAKRTFSTPMYLPSIEQIRIKKKTPFASQQLILLYLELFLICAVRNHPENTMLPTAIPKASPEKKSTKREQLDEVLQYMELHISEKLRVSDICTDLSISRSSLHSLFSQMLHCGVIEYFNNMKIQCACDIIRNGTMNLTEIACHLSYSSQQYFSRQFKAVTGMSPSEYSSSVKGLSGYSKAGKQPHCDISRGAAERTSV